MNTPLRYPEVCIDQELMGGNVYGILGAVQRGLERAGASAEEVTEFMDAATSGDHGQLLRTVFEWVDMA